MDTNNAPESNAEQSRYRLRIEGSHGAVTQLQRDQIEVRLEDPGPIDSDVVAAELYAGQMFVQQLRLKVDGKAAEAAQSSVCLNMLDEPVNIERADALAESNAAINRIAEQLEYERSIPEQFRLAVRELELLFSRWEEELDEMERSREFLADHAEREFLDSVADAMAGQMHDELPSRWGALHRLLEQMAPDQRSRAVEYCRSRILRFVLQSPCSRRTNRRPRGYPGDYEIMNLIYRNEIVGKSLFARSIHRYYMSHPNAIAVRNRIEYLTNCIRQFLSAASTGTVDILSVACGPAREISALVEEGDDLSGVRIDLLDQDEGALTDAACRIERACQDRAKMPAVHCRNEKIKQFIMDDDDRKYDFIYASGLFDYLPDGAALSLAKRMMQQLKPNGRVVIGNFFGLDEHSGLMELALDWHLIYRSREELENLFAGLGEVSVESEPAGINLFACISHGADRRGAGGDR